MLDLSHALCGGACKGPAFGHHRAAFRRPAIASPHTAPRPSAPLAWRVCLPSLPRGPLDAVRSSALLRYGVRQERELASLGQAHTPPPPFPPCHGPGVSPLGRSKTRAVPVANNFPFKAFRLATPNLRPTGGQAGKVYVIPGRPVGLSVHNAARRPARP